MSPTTRYEIGEALKHALCDSFTIDRAGPHEWIISSPFLFRDGDSYSVYLRRSGNAWTLSDDGSASAHLFFDDFELNDVRARHLQTIAEANGMTISDNFSLSRRLESSPEAEDIADLILTMAQVGALPHVQAERSDTGFRRAARTRVVSILAEEQQRTTDWRPRRFEHGGLWPADLWLPTEQEAVVAFFVGNGSRADRVASTINQYWRWRLPERPVVGIRRDGLSSASVARLQDATEDDSAVIAIDTTIETGILGMRRVLRERGVLVAA